MADSAVIREYLVSLGFKTDEKSLKNFTQGIEGAGKSIVKLVAAIEGAALAVGAGVAAFAANMDELYFASKRTDSSIGNMKAMGYAAKNLGASAEEAKGAIEGLARFMRDTPGAEGFLQSLGVSSRDSTGKLRDKTEVLMDIGKKLSNMPFYQAKAYAGVLGVSDNMLLAMRDGRFQEYVEKYRQLTKGTDFEAAAEKSRRFNEKLGEMKERIEGIGVVVASSLLDVLGPHMEAAAKWFEKNGDKVTEVVDGIAKAIVKTAEIITPILGKIAEGWKNIFDWANAAGEAMAANGTAENVNKLAGKGGIGIWLAEKLRLNKENPATAPAQQAAATPTGTSPGQVQPTQPAPPAKNGNAYEFFRRSGWSHEQASGIVANLNAESGMKANAVGDNGQAYGIAQWHPDRQANFAKWAGKDIRQSTADEQLAFVNYELTQGAERKAGELLKASTNARQAGEIMSRYYERPADAAGEAARRGAAAVQIAQTTNINVSGGSDPSATGRAVATEQQRVNSELTRNMQTAVS